MTEPTQRSKLENDGWTMRTIQEEPRLSEMCELYEEMGMEVLALTATSEDFCGGCNICFQHQPERCKVIFTRPLSEEI